MPGFLFYKDYIDFKQSYSSIRSMDTPTSKVGEELPLADRQLLFLTIITPHFPIVIYSLILYD